MTNNRSVPEMVERLWVLHRRGLSYASDTPAVNLLLADLSEGIADAARALAISSQAQSDDVVERAISSLRARFAIWREVKRLSLTCQERRDIERDVECIISAIPPAGECDHYKMVSGGNGPWTCVHCGAVDPERPKYGQPSSAIGGGDGR